MPEGDTIYRSARTLKAALAGRAVTGFRTVLPHLARGATPIAIVKQGPEARLTYYCPGCQPLRG